ncbi:MAG: Ig domain-containing protein [Blastocatellia bacterium]
MRKLSCLVAALLFAGATQAATVRAHKTHAAAPVTEIVLSSEPGDYVGQGKSYSYAEGDGKYEVFLRDLSHDGVIDDVIFSFNSADSWYLEFETSKAGTPLEQGFYDNAQRASFAEPNHPGFSVSGVGRGCNELTGSFTILDIEIDSSGAEPRMVSFAALFEQHCEGTKPSLTGHIYYNYSAPAGLAIVNPSALPEATVGRPYSRAFVAAGGMGPYAYRKAAGVIPPGLALSPGGTLSGTPTASGSYNFTAQVTDARGRMAQNSFSVMVIIPLSVTAPPELPAATLGLPYSYTLTAQGGSPPYKWEGFSPAQLPDGLTLNPGGTISGVPVTTSTFTITFRIKDAQSREAEETRVLKVQTVSGEVGLTQLTMSSEGDYVGSGLNYFFNRKRGLWFAAARDFTQDGSADYISLRYVDPELGGVFWSLDFSTAGLGTNLAAGVYENARRAPFAAPGHAGLDVSGQGRGCNVLTGRFMVLDAKFDYSGDQPKVISFAAKFEQNCEGGGPPLFGSIYYNSLARPNGSAPKITKVSYDARGELLTVKGKKFDPTASVIINGEMLRAAHFDSRNKISSKAIKVGSVVLRPGTYMIQVANLEGAISAPFAFSF